VDISSDSDCENETWNNEEECQICNNMSVEETQDSDEEKQDQSNDASTSDKWYITRKNGKETEKVHINKAFSYLIPREYMSRERSKRHIAAVYLPGEEPIAEGHDVVRFQHFAVKSHIHGALDIVYIVCLADKYRKCIRSCAKDVGQSYYQGRIYEMSNTDLIVRNKVQISPLTSVKNIIAEVMLKSTGKRLYTLTKDTKERLKGLGYCPNTLRCLNTTSKKCETKTVSFEGYYKVKSVSNPHWNPDTHTREFKTSFEGYGSDHDEWLPHEAFLDPTTVTSVSSKGRLIKHKAKPDGVEIIKHRKKNTKRTKTNSSNYKDKNNYGESIVE
jgi:hypothetical protein